jgi:hypothetical protein
MTNFSNSWTIAALLAAASQAAPPSSSNVQDRMEALCTVSDVDLVGKRMARQCRAQVRAEAATRGQADAARRTTPRFPTSQHARSQASAE